MGSHIVEAAVRRGHEVTLFNRRRSGPARFPDVETIEGDRDPDVGVGLTALRGRRWDVVVDTSGYVPRIVGDAAALLAQHIDHYIFISSIAAYADPHTLGITESHPLSEPVDSVVETINAATYGPLKVACEAAVTRAFAGCATMLRCGYIVGPGDPFERLTYWAVRVARGGTVLAPGNAEDPVQFIDARDVADFVMRCAENRIGGAFNVVGPASMQTMGGLLHRCNRITNCNARFLWIDAAFLAKQEVRFPICIWSDGPYRGHAAIDNNKAVATGLAFRPLSQTIRDTKAWFYRQTGDSQARLRDLVGGNLEERLLQSWRLWRSAEHGRARLSRSAL